LGGFAAACLLVSAIAGQPVQASSPFITFAEFLADTERSSYATAVAAGRAGAVRDSAAYAQMRGHILEMYQGVQAKHSYHTGEDYFDCVLTSTQPSVRGHGIKEIATPPPPATIEHKESTDTAGAPSMLTLGGKDAYGNAIACPDGTIPMRRITLERLSGFPTLKAFFAKGPRGDLGQAPPAEGEKSIDHNLVRHYAYGHQRVANHGGHSALGLYNPAGEFSISQQWYITESAVGMQTAEGGWIRYPQYFGSRSVTFVYFTADDYATTGCYNLDCVGFVQINRNWALGGPWATYSTPGGAQYEFFMQWYYYQGNWWMYLKGAGAMEAVGYYPASVYRGGPMAYAAQRADFGGEVAPIGPSWPAMGSGYHAGHGWPWAAFQRLAYYSQPGGATVWSSLSPIQTYWPYWSIAYTHASAGAHWGTYFYFGGPGGPF
jgi:hypothetical protein